MRRDLYIYCIVVNDGNNEMISECLRGEVYRVSPPPPCFIGTPTAFHIPLVSISSKNQIHHKISKSKNLAIEELQIATINY